MVVGQHQQPSQMTFIQYPVKIAPGKVNPGLLTTLLYNPHVHTFTHQTETILCWGNIGALFHTILQDMNNFEAFLAVYQTRVIYHSNIIFIFTISYKLPNAASETLKYGRHGVKADDIIQKQIILVQFC